MLEYMPLIAVATPFLGVLVVMLAGRASHAAANLTTAAVSAATLLATLAMAPAIYAGKTILLEYNTGFPVKMSFFADALSVTVAIVSAFVWTLSSIYALRYMSHERHQLRFDLFSLFSLGGMMGIVLTGNLFSLYIFFELMAILSYVLVIHEETVPALRAGLKYLFMGIIGGLVLLAAIIATYVTTGSVDITGTGIPGLAGSPWGPLIFWAFIFGFAIKAGMFPVHVWLPDAHPVAPSPASAVLSGIMIKAGIYGMIRTAYAVWGRDAMLELGQMPGLFWLGIITMLFASAVAITQTEIKRMLAYSSVAQIGYMVLGISLLTNLGLQGTVLHLVNHALMKSTLFLAAGAIILMTGLREVKSLGGIGRRMPITMACFTISALSMIGFPPFSGFISKWTLALGALEGPGAGTISTVMSGAAVTALLLSSLLNVVYYGPIMVRAWFGSTEDESEYEAAQASAQEAPVPRVEAPWQMTVPMVLLSVGTVVLGIFPQPLQRLAELVAAKYFGA
jgi:multicomponent Na+:H+ antiporter subunit D